MNQNNLIKAGEPAGGAGWLDPYLPFEGPIGSEPQKALLDFNAILGALFRQRWLIAATVILAFTTALVITLLTVPIYQSRATLQVDPFNSTIVEGQDLESFIPTNQVAAYIATQMEIIESRKTAAQVAELLKLDERAGFDVESSMGERAAGITNEQWQQRKYDLIGGAISGKVEASGDYSSNIIAISFSHRDPVFAAEVANAYAEVYSQSDTQRNLDSNAYAREYLENQIEIVRGRLQEAELAANDYAKNNEIVGIATIASSDDEGTTLTVAGSNLANINATFAQARARRITAEQKWRAVANLPAAQLPEVQSSPVVASLSAQLAEARGELVDLRRRYEENFPEVLEVKSRIASFEDQIATTSNNIKASIRGEYQIALRQENALKSELEAVSRSTLDEQDRQIEYAVLTREAEALRSQLDNLLNRFNTISTAANIQTGRITKLDSALVPTSPVTPNLLRNLLIGLVSGIALAAVLAVLREIFDDRLRSTEQVSSRLGLPLVGQTPYADVPDGEEEPAQFGELMEAYASIRSTIDYSVPRDQCVLLFTSSKSGEGKSTTAMIVADLFAHLGRKVLLIDGDLRRPSVASLSGVEKVENGLTEVLLGHCTLEDAIIDLPRKKHSVLPVNASPTNPTDLLASAAFKKLMADVRKKYSMVIIDSPPVIGLADAPTIAAEADACVFVVEANSVRIAQARAAIRRLRAVDANILGAVMTKYRSLTAGEGYGYGYGSGYYNYAAD